MEELRSQAREHFRARRFGQAAEAYERATRIAPRDAALHAGLGAARLANGDARGAVGAYERAVAIQPSSAQFHAALGRACLEAGQRDRARQEFQRALQIDPNNRDATIGMSRL